MAKKPSNVVKLKKRTAKARAPKRPRVQVCVLRPNRAKERHFTERDAAKILCHVVRKHHGSRARFETEFRKVCQDAPERKSAAEAALELAVAQLESDNEEWLSAFHLSQIVNGILSILFAALPFLRLPGTIARLVSRAKGLPPGDVPAIMERIVLQRAANERPILILRQAAANEARFRLSANE